MCISPLRNVPVVTTSARQAYASPSSIARPTTRPFSTRIRPARADQPFDVRLGVERRLHPCAVDPLVCLRTRRPDRRPAAAIEQLELDRRSRRSRGPSVRRARRSRERDDPSRFRRSPDCTACARRCRRQRAQPDARAETRRRVRRLASGMARADDDHVECRHSLRRRIMC